MTPRRAPILALLRHADTAWSVEGRIQGRADQPLLPGISIRLPQACRGMRIVTSPLARCVQTAALLGAADAPREPRLAEMHWGAWEGRRLEELRNELGTAMRENEARGFDFRPEGGESPREVLARITPWLAELEGDTFAITHRGVIRVILAAATGWDLRGRPPAKLDWGAAHLFSVTGGTPRVDRLNLR